MGKPNVVSLSILLETVDGKVKAGTNYDYLPRTLGNAFFREVKAYATKLAKQKYAKHFMER